MLGVGTCMHIQVVEDQYGLPIADLCPQFLQKFLELELVDALSVLLDELDAIRGTDSSHAGNRIDLGQLSIDQDRFPPGGPSHLMIGLRGEHDLVYIDRFILQGFHLFKLGLHILNLLLLFLQLATGYDLAKLDLLQSDLVSSVYLSQMVQIEVMELKVGSSDADSLIQAQPCLLPEGLQGRDELGDLWIDVLQHERPSSGTLRRLLCIISWVDGLTIVGAVIEL